MSDEQKTSQKSQYVKELTDLSKKFGELVKATLESPQLQEIRKDVAEGFQSAVDDINQTMIKARESDVTKDVVQKATSTVEDMKTSPTINNLKESMIKALQSANKELDDLLQKMNQSRKKTSNSAPSQEETPIETTDDDN